MRQDHNSASVRELLLASFTPEELRRFCQDRPAFRSTVNRFGPGHGLDDMVDEVIAYCEARALFDELLVEVKEANPRQYARFEPLLRISTEALAAIPCPYRGLEPFEAQNAEFYFGREAMIEELAAKVQDHPLVAVVGSSGCGKSSLVRAGLVTSLRDGVLAE
jgi:ABC-type multidrug transport system fused ATPase/permease subunit